MTIGFKAQSREEQVKRIDSRALEAIQFPLESLFYERLFLA